MQCLDLPKIVVSLEKIPATFIAKITDLIELSRQKNSKSNEIERELKETIVRDFPQLLNLGKHILGYIESEEGFVVVKNLPFLKYDRPIADWLFLSLMACLGNLTIHDDCQQMLWEVTPRIDSGDRELTFSELNVAAPMHSDSAFRQHPEEYFGLFALKSAKFGGHSQVIQVDRLIRSLAETDFGLQCLSILRSEVFPFRVPPAFASSKEETTIQATIIDLDRDPLIRFRLDTILAGLKIHPELMTPSRLWALHYFNNFLEAYDDRQEVKLDSGDIIFINNHRTLHGRTAFSGNDRLLLRARVEKYRPLGCLEFLAPALSTPLPPL